jgi:hypothetical protein
MFTIVKALEYLSNGNYNNRLWNWAESLIWYIIHNNIRPNNTPITVWTWMRRHPNIFSMGQIS